MHAVHFVFPFLAAAALTACPPGPESPNTTESTAPTSSGAPTSETATDTGIQTVTFSTEAVPTTGTATPTTSETGASEPTTTEAPAVCGNGVIDRGEMCDDGNDNDLDDCTHLCRPPECGDGVVHRDLREECDDGNTVSSDACTNVCTAATCGDSFVHTGVEECDDGNAVDTDACHTDCTAAACGDGVIWADVEVCDDGFNDNAYGGCAPGCGALGPYCGDGIVTKIDINVPKGFEYCDPAGVSEPYEGVGCTDACLYDFSQVPQLFCRGVCSWAGPKECDQADADMFCVLRTGNPAATATSFTLGAPTDAGGFPCADPNSVVDLNGSDPRIWLGPMPELDIVKNIVYQTSMLKTAHTPSNNVSVVLGDTLECTAP